MLIFVQVILDFVHALQTAKLSRKSSSDAQHAGPTYLNEFYGICQQMTKTANIVDKQAFIDIRAAFRTFISTRIS